MDQKNNGKERTEIPSVLYKRENAPSSINKREKKADEKADGVYNQPHRF
jgi:hypothetical protein